jgi:hypothetical protein
MKRPTDTLLWDARCRPPDDSTPGASSSHEEMLSGPETKRMRKSSVAAAPKRKKKEHHDIGGYICEFVEAADEIESEIWAKVPESIGGNAYVSNFGRYKSCLGVVTTPTARKNGYVPVKIGRKKFLLHRVMLEAFGVEPPSSAHKFGNHKDRDPSNNRLENLGWSTHAENIQHSYATNADRKSKLYQGNISLACREGGEPGGYAVVLGEPNERPLLEGEEWKPYGKAKISNLGRYEDCRGGIKTPTLAPSGYAQVMIDWKNELMHRLVAKLFLPPPRPGQTQVDHIFGMGNQWWNLRWATPSDNIKHSFVDPDRKSNALKLSKKVRCRRVGTTEWRVFVSGEEAGRVLGLRGGNVRGCCRANA